MEAQPIEARQRGLFDAIKQSEFAALVLSPGPSFIYFTGLDFHLSERPILAFFKPGEPMGLVLPDFEADKLDGSPYEIRAATYSEDPDTWLAAFSYLKTVLGIDAGALGGEPRNLRFLEIDYLQRSIPRARLSSAEHLITQIRIRKGQSEIVAIRSAIAIAEEALKMTLPEIRLGMTEKELARDLTSRLLAQGSDPQLPFFPIVAFGPNSALPHGFPSERKLQENDLILIDWGANSDGYFSDMTRVFLAGEDPSAYQVVADVVVEANAAARSVAGPGIQACQVDRAAREVIQKANLGLYFTHRTGHGIGLDIHEPPYIRGDNDEILEPGMTFTVEPGIYFPERFGVRIEDNILITKSGSETLTSLPRELTPIESTMQVG